MAHNAAIGRAVAIRKLAEGIAKEPTLFSYGYQLAAKIVVIALNLEQELRTNRKDTP